MARLHVRLDAERRRRLGEIAEERGVPISEVVRHLIDDALCGAALRERRKHAVERLTKLEVEDPPDAATLSRRAGGDPDGYPPAFIDATAPSTRPCREPIRLRKEPCARVLMMVAEHPRSIQRPTWRYSRSFCIEARCHGAMGPGA